MLLERNCNYMKNSAYFFRNHECAYFPCHKTADDENFNCLFCFCPLYHLEECGGNYAYTENGIKDCSGCLIPHRIENYEYIIRKSFT